MLLDKYAPKTTKEIIGNPVAIDGVRKFLATWKKGRMLLVHGPPGCGKSASIRLLAAEGGYELTEMQPDDDEKIMQGVMRASSQQGVFSKKKLFLVENLEILPARFLKIASVSGHPVVCTTNDAYQLSPAVRKIFKIIKFEKPGEQEILARLERICRLEGITCTRRELEQLVRMNNCDIRATLIDMEAFRLGFKYGGYRDAESTLFQALKIIFKTMSMENAKIAMDAQDGEELFRWLDENIAYEYHDIESIATAYDYLSKADMFRSRVMRRQQWNLQKYSALAGYGTALAKKRTSVRFVSYRPPAFIRNNTGLRKIARQLHVSRSHAHMYIPILRLLAKRNSRIFEELGLDDKEIGFILGNSQRSKRG